MRERYIPALIMLIAGTVTSVINIMSKVELIIGLKRLLLVLVIFYFIGLIAKLIIVKALNTRPKQEEAEKSEGNEETEKPQKENT